MTLYESRTYSAGAASILEALIKALLLILAAAGLVLQAGAQAATGSERAIYTAGDFAEFAPRTALDMVEQIPGFNLSRENDSRGFGQAEENVLINGQRVSTKSTGARDTLARIPAANIIRIEILDGASLDIPGLSGQVVNIVARASKLTGTWNYRQRYREGQPPVLDWGEISLSGKRDSLEWGLGLKSEPGYRGNAGRADFTDGAGRLLEYSEEDVLRLRHELKLNGTLGWTSDQGTKANLNADYALIETQRRETANRFLPEGTEFQRQLFQFSEDEWNGEISADIDMELASGRLKLIGLMRAEHSPTQSRAYGALLNGTESADSVFERTLDESETILRGEYSWQSGPTTDWQISLETAYNRLDATTALFSGPLSGPLEPVTLEDPDIGVEETRIEAFLSHGRQLKPDLRLQASLGIELSELSSSGAETRQRAFTRPKGSMSLAWQQSQKLSWTAEIERRVGQLNFFDFVSNLDLDQGDDQQGNRNIVPAQSWRASLQAERGLGDWGAVSFQVFAEDIEDLTDLIPIGDAEGPGNIDSARKYGLEAKGTLKLDKLGWSGARLNYDILLQDSSVEDPLTRIQRNFNDETLEEYNLRFRHDIAGTDWAWGINYRRDREAPVFRRRVRIIENQSRGYAWGFVEHKDLFGLTGTVYLANLLDSDRVFQRIEYDPDRTGEISRIENRTANSGTALTLRLKGTF